MIKRIIVWAYVKFVFIPELKRQIKLEDEEVVVLKPDSRLTKAMIEKEYHTIQ